MPYLCEAKAIQRRRKKITAMTKFRFTAKVGAVQIGNKKVIFTATPDGGLLMERAENGVFPFSTKRQDAAIAAAYKKTWGHAPEQPPYGKFCIGVEYEI
jgi:hypothetical protein